ncbi:MAG: hypothetical protein JXB08_03805 [Bacilli bacterium]|nr:hypothetical protein [Bacilli bacterium]
MEKDNKDIRKEIEELEKLIDKVKKQNEEEKKKHQKQPRNTVVKINLASVYSMNFWINMIFAFLVNFIVIFSLLKLFDFETVENDIYIVYLVGIFTVVEELYRKYMLAKQVKIVLYTSGLVFTFFNILIFYILDLVVFRDSFSFVDYLYPVAFVVLFQGIRGVIKNLYLRLNHRYMLKKMKRK